jgi:hypothetical protein
MIAATTTMIKMADRAINRSQGVAVETAAHGIHPARPEPAIPALVFQ